MPSSASRSRPVVRASCHLLRLAPHCSSFLHGAYLLTLHFNIKGCTYRTESDAGVLTVYSGGKRYEDPREARRHEFLYTVPAASRDYLHIVIASGDGTLDTYDYRVDAEAMPLGEQTFAYVRFTYRYRMLTRMMSSRVFHDRRSG